MYRYITVDELETKLKENKFNFLNALYMANYTPYAINNNMDDDSKLLNMAVRMYNDPWDSFEVKNFESQLNRGWQTIKQVVRYI